MLMDAFAFYLQIVAKTSNVSLDRGHLWVKEKPGSDKSTLMKAAFHSAQHKKSLATTGVTCSFFNARGGELERSQLGRFRSLLYQLLSQDSDCLSQFMVLYQTKDKDQGKRVQWNEGELNSFLYSICTKRRNRQTFTFIDAIDEYASENLSLLVYNSLFSKVEAFSCIRFSARAHTGLLFQFLSSNKWGNRSLLKASLASLGNKLGK